VPAYEYDDDPARVDREVLWEFFSTEAYWGRWRTRDDVERQIAASWRVVGAYEPGSGRMVGFARAVSDGVVLAYLADVFVVAGARGRGVGTGLVRAMIDDGPGAGFRWMLHTLDAHALYERFGFRPPDATYLERPGVRQPSPPARAQSGRRRPTCGRGRAAPVPATPSPSPADRRPTRPPARARHRRRARGPDRGAGTSTRTSTSSHRRRRVDLDSGPPP
jgi:GNAT superfamily N-acetyltransferase